VLRGKVGVLNEQRCHRRVEELELCSLLEQVENLNSMEAKSNDPEIAMRDLICLALKLWITSAHFAFRNSNAKSQPRWCNKSDHKWWGNSLQETWVALSFIWPSFELLSTCELTSNTGISNQCC